jgi:hypothetical protein
MKKKILLLLFWPMLAVMSGVFGSCNPDNNSLGQDEDTFLVKLQSAPVEIVGKNSFPEWLLKKIDEIETQCSKDINIIKIRIYQGEWQNQTVYFINDNLSSCFFCDIFYNNGETIDLSNRETANDFNTASKNWTLIYEFGNGVIY